MPITNTHSACPQDRVQHQRHKGPTFMKEAAACFTFPNPVSALCFTSASFCRFLIVKQDKKNDICVVLYSKTSLKAVKIMSGIGKRPNWTENGVATAYPWSRAAKTLVLSVSGWNAVTRLVLTVPELCCMWVNTARYGLAASVADTAKVLTDSLSIIVFFSFFHTGVTELRVPQSVGLLLLPVLDKMMDSLWSAGSVHLLKQDLVSVLLSPFSADSCCTSHLWPHRPKWVALILGHNTECDDFRSAGQKYWFSVFDQNRVLQAFFCSKTLLVRCDVLWQFQAF